MSSEQTACIRWENLHPDFHRLCEFEYLNKKSLAHGETAQGVQSGFSGLADPREWQQDPRIIAFAAALVRSYGMCSTKILKAQQKSSKKIDAFVIWILQVSDKLWMEMGEYDLRPFFLEDHENLTPRGISWSNTNYVYRDEFINAALGHLDTSAETYRSDLTNLGVIVVPIHSIIGSQVHLGASTTEENAVLCISQLLKNPGLEDRHARRELRETMKENLDIANIADCFVYYLAEPGDVGFFHATLKFQKLCMIKLQIGTTAAFSAQLMLRWPDSYRRTGGLDDSQRMAIHPLSKTSNVLPEYTLEFEDRDSDTTSSDRTPEVQPFDRRKWKSSWVQKNVEFGQLYPHRYR
ncbi:hypothetical protein F5Y19DRAFT_479144 [Xylariaceae sp. FL1651]|nr:hypothetical protein F5Y19DRAFT_479144 [Xylariaceae sp. FL1651]